MLRYCITFIRERNRYCVPVILFLHTGAYWLLHQLRQAAPRRSPWRTATFETLRRAFLKIAVRIEELRSRVTIAFPSAYPYRKALISMAGSIAAQGP